MSKAVEEIFSIGHSVHEWDGFLSLLRRHQIERLVDVRTTPKSRRLPHFNQEALGPALRDEGIDYSHMPELGGWRRPMPGSPNLGWKSGGFQGYADYMGTPEFESALERLIRLAQASVTGYICAEGRWWQCHRRLISDALVVRGWLVRHILPKGESEEHALTPFALVEGTRITYPPAQDRLQLT
jgi:uncharacterized protein (DUF488 family)